MEQPIHHDSKIVIEEVTDPEGSTRSRVRIEQFRRNSDWLQAHWGDVVPKARGKFVAVAGEEAFIAGTPRDAWAWAAAQHPEDQGPVVQYVRLGQGPRIYADRG